MGSLARVRRAIWLWGALLAWPLSAQEQVVLPVFRASPASPTLLQSQSSFDIDRFNGCPYVSIADVAGALNGTLHWRPVAHTVDLSIRGRTVSFAWNSSYVHMGNARAKLEHPAVKTENGLWVPVRFFASREFFSAVGSRVGWKEPVGAKTAVVPANQGTTMPSPRQSVSRPPAVAASSAIRAVRRIVIDPGHGGKDPGTIGIHGVEEKALNLQLAQALAQLLRDRYGYEVLMTRTDDTFIPLAQRSRIANHWNADLFVSVHCNASLSPKLHGFEVYFLSEKASDAHADAVARAENASLALEGQNAEVPGQLKALLQSLVKNANINDASALGSLIDREVNQRLKTPSLGVQQAGFYVLRGAQMPAVLIESGFLSNGKEERKLQDAGYRGKLMEDVASSIDAYDQRKQKERR